ncbi:hypothetical protein U6B65_09675 [Oscillospiraceae bacterium MB08-C2-2]|nr:hypothetical protein U6B65_09675 [Oscillospiraceae bacterium MB08-C2-2]
MKYFGKVLAFLLAAVASVLAVQQLIGWLYYRKKGRYLSAGSDEAA